MEKYIEIMKQSVELTETISEGVEHIQKLLGQGKFGETMYLFDDIVTAFAAVQRSLSPVLEQLESSTLDSVSRKVQEALELVVSAYEAKQAGKVQEIIQFTLSPQLKKWRQELDTTFQPYILS